MILEYTTSIKDYDWNVQSQIILSQIQEGFTNTLCKEKVSCKFKNLNKNKFFENQAIWSLR